MVAYLLVALASLVLAQLSAIVNHRANSKLGLNHGTSQEGNASRWNVFDFLLIALLVIFSAARYFVGTDFGTYLSLHLTMDPRDPIGSFGSSPVEIGYTALSMLVRMLFASQFAIFWVTSVLAVVPMYIAIKRTSMDLPFSIAIYLLMAFYVLPFNMIRQGIALSLLFLAHTFYAKNRRLYYWLSAAAGLFHYTAWFAAAAQWSVLRWRPSLRAVVSIAAGIFIGGIIFVLVNMASPETVSGLLGFVNPRYEDYFKDSSSGIGTYLILATRLGLLGLALALFKRSRMGAAHNWEQYGPWVTFVVFGACFVALGTQAVNIGRIDYYFSVFLVVLIPNLVAQMAPPARTALSPRVAKIVTLPRVIKLGFLVCGTIYFALFVSNFGELVPYQTQFGF